MSLLTATDLVKKYRSRTVLDCSLELPAGKVIALVGPNGAGKTTLLNIATGLTAPTNGKLRLFDELAPGSPQALSRVAYVAQNAALPSGLTIGTAISVTSALNDKFDEDFALERLEQMRLTTKDKVSSLSGGQRAQVSLTLALARMPDALILDEPTAALDPLARHEFLASLVAATSRRTLSIVFSSHSVEELEAVSDYVALLSRGRLAVNAPTDDVLAGHALVFAPLDQLKRASGLTVIDPDATATTGHHLVRLDDPNAASEWQNSRANLHRIVLGYLRSPAPTLEMIR